MSTIKDLIPLQLKTNTLYHLYVNPLSGLVKLKFILSSILSPLLIVFKYRKVTNIRPHSHRVSVNLNILLCLLGYITV